MRILCSLIFLFASVVYGKGEYQSVEQFIAEQFVQAVPSPSVVWLTKEKQASIETLIGHQYHKLRLRYWQASEKTVWILDEIGKESPITLGIVVQQQQIKRLKVLTYRETRGDEVRHAFFTDQFIDTKLTPQHQLDKHIDGISGATLSVKALSRMAKLALWLDQQVKHD